MRKFTAQWQIYSSRGFPFLITAFGLGATLLDGLRLMQFINNPEVLDCYGGWYIASCSVNIFYHWIQIFFVLKFHKVSSIRHMHHMRVSIWPIR